MDQEKSERTPPVREGDILDVQVMSVGAKGDGVVKHEGYVIFVPGTTTGDNVTIKITTVMPTSARAEVVSKHDISSDSETQTSEGPLEDSERFGE